ncbi:MAG: M36 family metallopeptidase, partial [Chloroflexi bacterium]|nr:M36 family metallopeptidase [Chloroflexota bacterium]
ETYNLQESNRGNVTGSNKENDPELGNVQAGAIAGGFPMYLGRNNANQITLNDGIPGITNMYLWQSLAATFYGPCVDGDYDMSVVAHEYGHAIQNRMVAGPDAGLTGAQSQSMGESWSDLTAIEFLNGYSLVPIADENPFAVGPYVTGSKERGIRNYGMNRSPLNFSNLGYDGNGSTSPHADGEIWSATNYEIRQALIAKYNSAFPASNQTLQRDCADGKKSVDQCPGNRRWIQLMHDAFLLMQSDVSMDDARDAYLAADQMRFGGANQRELWRAFAQRGLGKDAFSVSGDDPDAMPSFESPLDAPATITFRALAGNEGNRSVDAKVFVGQHEARAVPIADTDPSTPLVVSSSNVTLSNVAKFAPGTYSFLIQAPGYGAARITKTFTAGQTATLTVYLPTNYASVTKGATASGQGIGLNNLIDDTETTNAARLNAPVAGTTLTVDLSGGARQINRVQVSAALRPEDANDPAGDTAAQSRFTALRQFEIWTCNADDPAQQNCASSANFAKVFTSAADAFPASVPRPTAGDLTLRSFDIPATTATHVQLRVVSNQCTGAPAYQGDTDNDPTDNADCDSGTFAGEPTTAGQNVRIAELQVFSGSAR